MSKHLDSTGAKSSTEGGVDRRVVFSHLKTILDALWASRQRVKLVLLAVAAAMAIFATAYFQVRLTLWVEEFSNSLAKERPFTIYQIAPLIQFAAVLVVLDGMRAWLKENLTSYLRQGLVDDLLSLWLSPLRAYRLSHAGTVGDNPDYRITRDVDILASLSSELGIEFFESICIVAFFINLLWILSPHIGFSISGHDLNIPGFMLWLALVWTGSASILNIRVSRGLIALKGVRSQQEAEFHSDIAHVNEEIAGVSLYGGEADERARLEQSFSALNNIYQRISEAESWSNLIKHFYQRSSKAIPILATAPFYFTHRLNIGELAAMLISFEHIERELRWFVDNYDEYTNWRAAMLRVAIFRQQLLSMDQLGHAHSKIILDETSENSIAFDDLVIAGDSAVVCLSDSHVELQSGERVLVTGDDTERSLLFRSIAGLWPWGSGRITRPPRDSLMFIPSRPQIPPGTLRAAVTYPHPAEMFEHSHVNKALTWVGLEHYVTELDVQSRWDRRLTDAEARALAFARVVLQQPRWVVANGALDDLDPTLSRRIESLLTDPLQDVGVINIGRDQGGGAQAVYARKLRLVTRY